MGAYPQCNVDLNENGELLVIISEEIQGESGGISHPGDVVRCAYTMPK